MTDKVILTDIDGVCLNWADPFEEYLESRNFAIERGDNGAYEYTVGQSVYDDFNNSIHATRLPPMHDSLKWMRRIHDDLGFKFHGVTHMGVSEECIDNRKTNLEIFGDIWLGVDHLYHTECKSQVLANYEDSGFMWVEDLHVNAEVGLEYGLVPVLMCNTWNRGWDHPDIPRVTSWRDIYEMLNTNVD